jgi:hypothetical protein
MNMRDSLYAIMLALLLVTSAAASGCSTIGTAAEGTGEVAGDAVEGTGDVIQDTAEQAEDDLDMEEGD